MIEPEISRRCPDCGASIRERAVFCPQCGRNLDRTIAETTTLDDTVIERANPVDENGGTPTEIKEPVRESADQLTRSRTERPAIRPLVVQNGKAVVKEKTHRATAAAREVIEDNLLPRVERFRKVSSVVIDQAAYDPSLRFVLVAILLFAVFLVILLLNELVG
jgi:hypothetical protein